MVSSLFRHLSAMIELLPTIKREKSTMNITTIGLDIAKRVFLVVCCNQQGQLVGKKKEALQRIAKVSN
jgi:hypothetical protein